MGNKTNKISKTHYDAKKALAIKKLAEDYSCTPEWIRLVLNDGYKPANAEEIKNEFERIYSELNKILN